MDHTRSPPVSPHLGDSSPLMGLHKILKKVKLKEKEIRLLMLGLDNAGKTTILKKFMGENTEEIEPTLGFNIKTIEFGGYKLNVWDVGGQTTIRSYWRNYFEATDGLVWVVDSADKRRLEDCRNELHALLDQERLAGASLLVFVNKQDVENAATAAEVENALGLSVLHDRNRRFFVQPCSAQTGMGLETGIEWMVKDVASRIYMLE